MVGYELLKLTDEEALYSYYPENDHSNAGIVSFDRASNRGEVLERAQNDNHSSYSGHMFSQLREFNASGEFRETGYVAWY